MRWNLSEAKKVQENLFETDTCVPKRPSTRSNVMGRRGQRKARVKLDRNNAFLQEVNDHTHPLTQTSVEVVKVMASIKRRAETCYWRIGGDFRSCWGKSATDEQHKKKYPATTSS